MFTRIVLDVSIQQLEKKTLYMVNLENDSIKKKIKL